MRISGSTRLAPLSSGGAQSVRGAQNRWNMATIAGGGVKMLGVVENSLHKECFASSMATSTKIDLAPSILGVRRTRWRCRSCRPDSSIRGGWDLPAAHSLAFVLGLVLILVATIVIIFMVMMTIVVVLIMSICVVVMLAQVMTIAGDRGCARAAGSTRLGRFAP